MSDTAEASDTIAAGDTAPMPTPVLATPVLATPAPVVVDDTMPSDDEIAQANAIFQRINAANAAKRVQMLPDVKAMIAEEGFAPILAEATRLRDLAGMTGPFFAQLNAIVVGMTEVTSEAAKG